MIEIKMPRLSDTMEEGAIATWHKKPGDQVAVGDVLVEIETDKAVMEYEAYEAGTLAEILVPEGENADIGTPIALLDDGAGVPATVPAVPRPPPTAVETQADSPERVAPITGRPRSLRRPQAGRPAAPPRPADRRAAAAPPTAPPTAAPPGRLPPGTEAGQGEPPGPVARHGQRTWRPHHPRRHQRPARRRRARAAARRPRPPRSARPAGRARVRRRPCSGRPPRRPRPARRARPGAPAAAARAGGRTRCAARAPCRSARSAG